MPRILIVSNRLPVKLQKKDGQLQYKTSEGGLATGLGSIYKAGDNQWIGWPGLSVHSDTDKKEIRKGLGKENMIPVFLSQKEIKEFYEGFSNETLWPNFHYFTQYSIYNDTYRDAYEKVNAKYCAEVLKVAKAGDTIWVHDYQLLLLPRMLREKLPDAKIGFFLHIPFPSYEVFRLLPWREELLKGILGADLIGFHTYDYVRHFLSSISRILGVYSSGSQIEYGDRTIVADAFPMGIDYERYEEVANSEEAKNFEKKYRKSLKNRKVILSIDRLDYSKGIPQRLKAFELFLKKYPSFKEKVSLIQIIVPSRDQVKKYKDLKEKINQLVGSINSTRTIDWAPIHYFYRAFPLESLAGFYRLADVALVTPMRDGMNLVCKEYIASRTTSKGVLILSEMAGAAIELPDAILINPNDEKKLAEAIYKALTMPEEEQERNILAMQHTIKKFNIHHWVKMFFSRLEQIKVFRETHTAKKLEESALLKLKEQWQNAKSKLILLDYDGTLMPFKNDPKEVIPDEALDNLLRKLSSDASNNVVVVSGRNKDFLEQWMGKYKIDLIAEHGMWLKAGKSWHIVRMLENSWKKDLLPVFEQYADRTPGAFVEEKDYTLVWHYRKVEPGLAELRKRELILHLQYLVSTLNLQVMEGSGVVELKNAGINKGSAALKWLEKNNYDLILAIGDDTTDEDLFKAMPENAITIKVRSSVSAAKYNLPGYKEVRKLLNDLAESVTLESVK